MPPPPKLKIPAASNDPALFDAIGLQLAEKGADVWDQLLPPTIMMIMI